jgi:hypothetical protein
VPLAVPLDPVVTVIHVALLVAVQPHPVPDVTDTLAAPPAAGAVGFSGDTVNVQAGSWVTVTVRPATVSVPVRLLLEGFTATV